MTHLDYSKVVDELIKTTPETRKRYKKEENKKRERQHKRELGQLVESILMSGCDLDPNEVVCLAENTLRAKEAVMALRKVLPSKQRRKELTPDDIKVGLQLLKDRK